MNAVLLDIGSGGVGLSLVEFRDGDIPVINFTAREEFNLGEFLDTDRIIPLTFSAIEKLKNRMDHATSVGFTEVHCFLSSHLVMSQASTARNVFDEPEVVTQEIIQSLVRGGLNYSLLAPNMEKVEEKIVQVKLNGYETAEPVGHSAREIEVTSFVSLAERVFLDSLRLLLLDIFHGKLIKFHSFASSSYGVIREIFSKTSNEFIYLDVGSEITEVGISRKGSLDKTISFPHGKSNLIRNLATVLGGMFPHIASEINAWSKGHFHEESDGEEAIVRSGTEWKNNFKSEVLSERQILPGMVFVISDEDVGPVYSRLIQDAYAEEAEVDKPEIRIINAGDLRDFVKNKSGFRDDSFLMSEAIFINKILSN